MKYVWLSAAVLAAVVVSGLLVSFSRPLEPMTRIDAVVVYPDGAEVATTWWRVGLILGRSESAESLVVYREPELWVVDLPRRTGLHVVDPGPSFGFHLPVIGLVANPDPQAALTGLEIGAERLFMEARGVRPIAGRYLYRDPESGIEAELQVDPLAGTPRRIELRSEAGRLVTIHYQGVQTGLPVEMGLFQAPGGVSLSEAR